MNYVDLAGDSVCVLLSPNSAGGMGHLGLLIQNEDHKWVLYSKNGGRGKYTSSAKTEEQKYGDDKGDGALYDSVEDFLNSDGNKVRTMAYSKGLLIPCDSDEDKSAADAISEEIKEPYNLINNNCAVAVQAALKAIDENTGNKNGIGIPTIIPKRIYHNIKNSINEKYGESKEYYKK